VRHCKRSVVKKNLTLTLFFLLWVAMITSAENLGWRGDVPVHILAAAGLPASSVIRTAKLATIEASDAWKLGRVPAALFRNVAMRLGQ
jgi:mRNA interferase MazF